jgi:hypothetical protein
MKTIKTLLSVVAIAAIFSTGAFAQAGNGTVVANAEVVGAMTVTPTDMEFGQLVTSQTKTIAFDSTAAGKFAVTGSSVASLNISITYPSTLDGDTESMSTGSYTAGTLDSGTDSPGSAASFGTLAGQTISGDFSPTGSAFYVYVGMSVTAGGSQAADEYAGDIDMTINYN